MRMMKIESEICHQMLHSMMIMMRLMIIVMVIDIERLVVDSPMPHKYVLFG